MFGAIAGGIASALAGGAMSKLFGGGQKAASGGIQGDVLATDNNTVGMGDAGIKSAIQGSNVPNPDEAVPSFVSGAMAKAGKGLLEGTLQAGTSAVSDKLLDLVGLGGKSAADKGKDTRDYLAAAFPELNAWERAGADASSAGMVDAGFENQKELTKMQLDNQKEIAEMQNETQKEIAGIQSATSRQNTKDQVYAQNEMLAYQQKESTARVASIMENTNLSKQQQVDRKSGSAGMPRPISYAVFCLKKKTRVDGGHRDHERHAGTACGGTVPHPQLSPPPARRDRRTELVHRSLAGLARFAGQLATRVVRARPAAHHVAPDGEPAGGPRRVAPRPRATAWLGLRPRPRPRAAVCARLRPDDEPVPLRRERAIRRHCQRQRRRHRPLPGCGAGPPCGRPGSDPAERNPATGAGPARPRHPSARQPDHPDPRIARFARLHRRPGRPVTGDRRLARRAEPVASGVARRRRAGIRSAGQRRVGARGRARRAYARAMEQTPRLSEVPRSGVARLMREALHVGSH